MLIDQVILDLPTSMFSFRWNWIGKIFETFVAAGYRPDKVSPACKIYRLSKMPRRPDAFLTATLLGVGLSCFHFYYFLQGQFVSDRSRTDLESILFQFTMPGLGEEMFYRGLLLAVLDRWLSRPWNFLGVKIGLGCLISSGIFVVAHVVEFSAPTIKSPYAPILSITFFVAAVALTMCYLRYKTESVLPCILAHNIVNGVRYVGSAIVYMQSPG